MTHLRFASAVVVVVVVSLCASTFAQTMSNPSARLVELNKKFDGAMTCNAAKCHGAGDTTSPPTKIASEYNIWKEKDAHHSAFESLTKPNTEKYPSEAYPNIAKIGANLKIADVTKDNRCLVCHALSVPANLQGEKFSIAEGNTCTACHGPSETWLKPHEKKEWTAEQRKKFPTHDALLKNVGPGHPATLAVRWRWWFYLPHWARWRPPGDGVHEGHRGIETGLNETSSERFDYEPRATLVRARRVDVRIVLELQMKTQPVHPLEQLIVLTIDRHG